MKKICVIIATLLTMLFIFGCQPTPETRPTTEAPTQSEAAETEQPSTSTTPDVETASEPEEMAKMGEEASDGQAAVTVHSVEFYDQITGGLGGIYRPGQEGYVFSIVDLTIRNVSGSALDIGGTNVDLVDSEGDDCPCPMLIIVGWPNDLTELESGLMSVGETRRGMVVFTAEEGARLGKVECATRRPNIKFGLTELDREKTDGLAAVTLNSVEFCEQITDAEGNTHKPSMEGYIYCVVDLTIRNASESVLSAKSQRVFLYDDIGVPRGHIMLRLNGWPYQTEEFDSKELAPDEEIRGIVIYLVEDETKIESVDYISPESTIEISLEGLEASVPPYRMPQIGEVSGGGGIEMRVSSVGSIEKLETEYGEDSEYFNLVWTETAREGEELVVVDLSIKNVSVRPSITINPLNVLLIDSESNAYGKVVMTLALEGELHLAELSPGEETFGRMLFSMPVGTTLDRVMYKIGALGPPVEVSLR